jgi:protein ImuB
MQADEVTHRALPNGELFPTPSSEAEGLIRLIERLQARLGHEQVQHLVLMNDHRPERGSSARALPGGTGQRVRSNELKTAQRASPPRPVWLLARPEPLREHQSRPWLDGQPLQLLSGPERIESGWWDAGLAERDYFIAQIPSGALVWIYRVRLLLSETPEHGWYLQGRFA